MATALEQCGIAGPKLQAMLEGTAKDIMKRIDLNLRRLEVGAYNPRRRGPSPDGRMPGTMARSIYWQVFNATNGDEAKIKFWMETVANYVELSVQGNYKGPSWRVSHGGLPASIAGSMYGAIAVNRRNEAGQVLKRKAKPFISGEIRVHGRMLFDRLVQHYAYVGNMVMASALDVREIVKNVNYMGKNVKGIGPVYEHQVGKRTVKTPTGTDLRKIESILEEMIYNRNNDVAALTHSGWTPGAHSSDRTREWLDNH